MCWSVLVCALGVPVRIDGSALSSADRAAVAEAWIDASEGSAPDPAFGGGEVVVVPEPLPTALMLQRLSQQVTLAAIEARRGRLWMLHAAGLALSDGRVVALVGPSGRGKTTAARALGTRFGYVSDETVGIGLDGRVWPYRKPLSVIEDARAPKAERSSSSLGLRGLPDAPLSLAAVIVLDRRADAPPVPVIESVDLGDALAELVTQTSYLADLDSPLATMADLVARGGTVRRVVYREAAQLTDVLGALADGEAVPEAARPIARSGPRAPGHGAAIQAAPCLPAYFRAPVRDVLELADPKRLALLQVDAEGAGVVRLLAGIAPTLWEAAEGAQPRDLLAAAVAAHGAPDCQDAAALVDAASEELVDMGVLQHREPRWRIADTVAWVDSGDRIVFLADGDHSVRLMDLNGARVWRALDEAAPVAIDALADAVARSVGLESAAVRDGVSQFVSQLAGAGVVSPE